MTTYARTIDRYAPLSSDFARDFVERRFGKAAAEVIYETAPKFTRGPRKGLPKGYVLWTKCESGGWFRPNPGSSYGHVLKPGTHRVRITKNNCAPPSMGFHESTWGGLPEGTSQETWLEVVRRGISAVFGLKPC